VSIPVFLFSVYKELMLKVNYVGTLSQSPSMSTNNPLDLINTTRLLKTKKKITTGTLAQGYQGYTVSIEGFHYTDVN